MIVWVASEGDFAHAGYSSRQLAIEKELARAKGFDYEFLARRDYANLDLSKASVGVLELDFRDSQIPDMVHTITIRPVMYSKEKKRCPS